MSDRATNSNQPAAYARKWCLECSQNPILMQKSNDDTDVEPGWIYRWYKCPTCGRRTAHRRRT